MGKWICKKCGKEVTFSVNGYVKLTSEEGKGTMSNVALTIKTCFCPRCKLMVDNFKNVKSLASWNKE